MSQAEDHPDERAGSRSGPGPQVMGACTLVGDSVVDPHGEQVGQIKEIMLEMPSGRIAYAVLAAGELAGPADKLFAVPWPALTLDAARRRFVLEVDKARLQQAPGFDPQHWPTMAQPTWDSTLYQSYGVEPYRE